MRFRREAHRLMRAVHGKAHRLRTEDIATTTSATIGSGAVVRDEPVRAANAWAKGLGRKPTGKDRAGWAEYAQRMNMSPDDEVAGWQALEWIADPRAALRAVFETTMWAGYSVPNLGLVQTASKPTDLPAWGPVLASFPFATEVARRVWETALKLILKYKTNGPGEILQLAIDASKVSATEMTPEDLKLLQLAIAWAQNGPVKTSNRLGGAPGGPLSSTRRDPA